MSDSPDLVILGQVLVRADAGLRRTAGGLAIRGGRVVATGERDEIRSLAGPATRVVNEPELAVIPGLHDFHLHLIGLARMRRELRLDGLHGGDLERAAADASRRLAPGEWLRGRGWGEAALAGGGTVRLVRAVGDRPALVYSHDSHSAWASPAALAAAGIGPETSAPAGGRIERDSAGLPTGVLRERATDMVEQVAARLGGRELEEALDQAVAELLGWGVTGASDAGDTSADNGVGEFAALGDRASLLLAAAPRLDGRLRLSVGMPAEAIEAASGLGIATGRPLPDSRTVRGGWAKAYADGALGSRTAALFDPSTCGAPDTGILRLQPDQLDALVASGRRAGIGLAVHAIGDRAAATVLDALERAPGRATAVPPDRVEHLQLLRPADRSRFARLDVTASVQPVHCAADREMVEACWADRTSLAYPWRSLTFAGARLAFGSDAPIETANPFAGLFAAVHRRFAHDGTHDWHPAESLGIGEALAAYTIGPARAMGRTDEGHLEPGARADVAVLDVGLDILRAADERLAGVRASLAFVDGREAHRA